MKQIENMNKTKEEEKTNENNRFKKQIENMKKEIIEKQTEIENISATFDELTQTIQNLEVNII